MSGTATSLHLVFDPYLPWWALGLIGVGLVALLARRLVTRRPGGIYRLIAIAGLLLALANPWMVEEQRKPLRDVAIVAVDRSMSQTVTGRQALLEKSRTELMQRLSAIPNLDVREVDVTGEQDTELRPGLSEALRDTGADRLAGTFLLTDGLVADASLPDDLKAAPIHRLVTGSKTEIDRRIQLYDAPKYAIVGRRLNLVAKVLEDGGPGDGSVPVTLRLDGKEVASRDVPVGVEVGMHVPIDRPGKTTVELTVGDSPDEIATVNNTASLIINGVRDRLRVLLITGEPYQGARMWRDILKSDGAVDLVHFTILRPPLKQDFTPVNELSLIAFPTHELFQQKLNEFDLIVFDRYFWRGVLPLQYLANVAHYVRAGGAVLSVAGPDFAGSRSLYTTPLSQVLPAAPTGQVLEEGFKPDLTDIGRRHPITRALLGRDGAENWGDWYRQIDTLPGNGTPLMNGISGKPLLVVNRVGKGRVAQLLSDESWLWARGHQNGGPQGEMLRRLAHWLMKEPELEEETLNATATANGFAIKRTSIGEIGDSVTVQYPDGHKQDLPYTARSDGEATAGLEASAPGLYRFTDGPTEAVAAFGPLQSPELNILKSSADRLDTLTEGANGATAWLGDEAMPSVRTVEAGARTSGSGWMGVERRNASLSTGLRQTALLPPWVYLMIAGGGLMLAWWREGRPG
jgi:hypothetical protein